MKTDGQRKKKCDGEKMKKNRKNINSFYMRHRMKLFLLFGVLVCSSIAVFLVSEYGYITAQFRKPETFTIENEHISVEYVAEKGHIKIGSIQNKRIDGGKKFTPQEGSEDFVIGLLNTDAPSDELDKTGWKIAVKNSDGVEFSQEEAARLIDGSTLIHFHVPEEYTESASFVIDLDFGSEQTVSSFGIDKRSGDCNTAKSIEGTMGKYKLFVSDDGVNYTPAGEGEFTGEDYHLHEGAGICMSHFAWHDHLYNKGERVYANLDNTCQTRYVRLIQETSVVSGGGQNECYNTFSSTEITLYADRYKGEENTAEKTVIKASDLIYKSVEMENLSDEKKLTIHYKPFRINGSNYHINQVVVLGNNDFYMRSFLEIKASEETGIDYIDINRFMIPENTKNVWYGKQGASGQPIYVDGLFMGSEFPAVHTWIGYDNVTQMRYYCGKSFARMGEDGQLTEDGVYTTWPCVTGVAWDTDTKIVQTEFYRYIEEIAASTEFRKQYNSWFDNGMGITDESIKAAFLGVEKGLTQNGIEPLDAYVVDDGWNNYYDGIYQVEPGENQGTTENRTGFWEFNAKFPNEMYTAGALSQRMQSAFGMWLGPQGGYVYDKSFSRFLENAGTGNVRTQNVGDGTTYESYLCVASDHYVENLKKFIINCDKEYGITYWKIDGLGSVCQNPAHGHMTGGYCDMYYTSDMWEKWTDLFEEIRGVSDEELFINATNGVILSPWILQWVNTVWVGGEDTGTLGTGERHQQKIYYRDKAYYSKFGGENEIQFPLGHMYNHDPIYAVSDISDATPEVFREYLFANAVRGTALWEMYFSPSIMDETKWQITADVLTWAEDNHEVLKKARYFGNSPEEGVYGYACFDGNSGIISFTNPLDVEQVYTLVVDGNVGADKNLTGTAGFQVYPYEDKKLEMLAYGEKVTVELNPHETIVLQYGMADTEMPEIVSARTDGLDKIVVKYDKRIYLDMAAIDDVPVNAFLQADYRTVVLQAEESFTGVKQVSIHARDMSGNVCESRIGVFCCGEDDIIVDVCGADDIDGAEDVRTVYDVSGELTWLDGLKQKYTVRTDRKLTGKGAFTISTGVQTKRVNMELISIGDDVKLCIDEEGYLQFTAGDLTLNSKENVIVVTEKAHGIFGTDAYVSTQTETVLEGKVNDDKEHTVTVVREMNGMLKLYLDGELRASRFDEKIKSQDLQGGVMTVADDSFSGKMAEIIVLNRALGYDEISKK